MTTIIHAGIPVLIGANYEHVMCRAVITEEGDKVSIEMSAEGQRAQDLLDVLRGGSPIALKIVAIPVTPRNTQL